MSDRSNNFADRNGKIWLDGELVDWRDATVHVLTHTLHYGVGCFEGIRAYKTDIGPQIFRLHEHTRRFFDSAKILRMTIPYEYDEIFEAQRTVFRANRFEEGYIRPLAFLGSNEMGLRATGLNVRVAIACWSWPSYMEPTAFTNGIRVQTSSLTRHHVNISMCKAKAVGHYINSVLALSEALDAGYDEALLLDNEGYVAEGSGENVFLAKDGVIHTPELTSCLPGITRSTLMTFAQDLGIEVRERRITRDELYIADECFMCGTAAEVVPIRELDNRVIGNGKRGAITEKLQSMYFDLVRGKLVNYADWLVPVN